MAKEKTFHVIKAVGLFLLGSLVFLAAIPEPPPVHAAGACPCFDSAGLLRSCGEVGGTHGSFEPSRVHEGEKIDVAQLQCCTSIVCYVAQTAPMFNAEGGFRCFPGSPNGGQRSITAAQHHACKRQLEEAAKALGIY